MMRYLAIFLMQLLSCALGRRARDFFDLSTKQNLGDISKTNEFAFDCDAEYPPSGAHVKQCKEQVALINQLKVDPAVKEDEKNVQAPPDNPELKATGDELQSVIQGIDFHNRGQVSEAQKQSFGDVAVKLVDTMIYGIRHNLPESSLMETGESEESEEAIGKELRGSTMMETFGVQKVKPLTPAEKRSTMTVALEWLGIVKDVVISVFGTARHKATEALNNCPAPIRIFLWVIAAIIEIGLFVVSAGLHFLAMTADFLTFIPPIHAHAQFFKGAFATVEGIALLVHGFSLWFFVAWTIADEEVYAFVQSNYLTKKMWDAVMWMATEASEAYQLIKQYGWRGAGEVLGNVLFPKMIRRGLYDLYHFTAVDMWRPASPRPMAPNGNLCYCKKCESSSCEQEAAMCWDDIRGLTYIEQSVQAPSNFQIAMGSLPMAGEWAGPCKTVCKSKGYAQYCYYIDYTDRRNKISPHYQCWNMQDAPVLPKGIQRTCVLNENVPPPTPRPPPTPAPTYPSWVRGLQVDHSHE